MSDYQLTLVLTEAAAKDEKKAQALFTDLVTAVKGKVKSIQPGDIKDLAYPIKGARRGSYWSGAVQLEKNQPAALDKLIKRNDNVLRFLLINDKES